MLVSLISVALKPDLKTSPFFGLAINYTLLIPIYLTWVVKFLNDLEIYLGAVDRIEHYTTIPKENYNTEGNLEFFNLFLKIYVLCRVLCVVNIVIFYLKIR